MSELTLILLLLCLGLVIIYSLLIRFSLSSGKSIVPYITCILVNIGVLLFFAHIVTRPNDAPLGGVGFRAFLAICGLLSVAMPIVSVIIFFVRKIYDYEKVKK
ncbi:hypothetical protein F0L74_28130 [Chitinophaga agrisoli]|uniref:Uncharacterized protein n=1 Tax=Chitinophaga agrisoli TaxID=2607653 RepID=A0A5B2VM77_9BACT|nr:hypothetical protein [Chitinophaga agrisoli]KAA2240045.1 hypothetical protein F0L74_28130 [Chitinophaga agrisoli]